jgi:hypothetical protein
LKRDTTSPGDIVAASLREKSMRLNRVDLRAVYRYSPLDIRRRGRASGFSQLRAVK